MSWGSAFQQAYAAATAAARAVADKTVSSVTDAAAAVARTARAAADTVADAAAAGARAAVAAGQAAVGAALAVGQAATQAAVAGAQAVAAGARVVGHAVAQGATAVGRAVASGASAVVTAVGEIVNTAVGVTVTLATSLYAAVKSVFSDRPPARTLTQPCPGTTVDIYNNDYRMALLDSTFDGAGEPSLAESMNALRGPLSPEEQERHLQTLATARHRPIEEMREEYNRYLQLRSEVDDRILARGLEPIDELRPEQAGFMGSTWQLRYGKTVGDDLGVDPVFGAMLNPTGGLVGPGNRGRAPDAWYMPASVAYHGAYHDAMGYLYNYHDRGAGYNYMQSPIGLGTSNPLAGQATGIMQWSINLAR